LKLKGQPRASKYVLIPEGWGRHMTPWIHEIAEFSYCLKNLQFKRMIIKDSNLELIAKSRG